MDIRLEGRTTIVTGAARGIGAACARVLAASGANVLATDVLDDEGEQLASSIEGGRVRYVHHDVTDERAWAGVVAEAKRTFGGLHGLVNNAGVGSTADVESETREEWDRVLAVNATGVWLGMKLAGPAIRGSGGGSIVNVASIFGSVGGFGGSVAYHASKGAVRLMTKNAALRWATEGIRVNSVHPAFIATPMIAGIRGTDYETGILQMTPMGRLGTPDEVAQVIVFLLSDLASYMTGSEVYVDGGWIAR